MGSPVDFMLPPHSTLEEREHLTRLLGLDKSLIEQYFTFLGNAFQGDFGNSVRSGVPVTELYLNRLPNTLNLALGAIIFVIIAAIPLGIVAALKRGTVLDGIVRLISTLGIAIPMFWLGLMLMQLFAVQLGWLPVAGMGSIKHYILPVVSLGFFFVAGITRLLRSSMLEVLDSEFVKMLRVKGLPEWKVILKHVFKNSVIPPLTLLGQYAGILMGGAVVIEVVFAWPGVGRMAYEAITFRDFPVIQGVIIFNAMILILASLVVDILYSYIDPRIKANI